MTTAPEIEWRSASLSASELSCPDACSDAAAESAVQANTRFGFGRTLLAILTRSAEPASETAPEVTA